MSFISPVATDTNGNPKKTGSLQELGKDDFLQLLVTKMQNQDPLNPTEDADFIAQLAQFSSLEQMNNISEGIESSNQWDYLQMQSLNNAMAAGFIGKEVTADYSGVVLDDTNQPRISFTLPQDAAEVRLVIKDGSGNVVTTLRQSDLKSGTNSLTWNGRDVRGNRMESGFYTIEAEAETAGGASLNVAMRLTGVVSKVVYRDGAAFINVGGTEIPLGDVKSIGSPGEESN